MDYFIIAGTLFKRVNIMDQNRFPIGKLLAALIVVAWLGVAGYYAYRDLAKPEPVDVGAIPDELLEEQWYSILFKGDKAGWAHIQYDRLDDGYVFRSDSLLKLKAQGMLMEAKILLDARVDGNFEMENFSLDFLSDLQNIHVDGYFSGNELVYNIQSPKGAKPETHKMKFAERPQLMDMVGLKMANDGIEVGRKIEIPVFDPISQRNDKAVAEVVGKETIDVGSGPVETFVVRVKYLGLEMSSWLDEKGRAIKSDAAMGFSMILVGKEEALKLDDAGKIDVIAASAVPVDVRFPNPRELKYLKIKLLGVEDLGDTGIDGGYQGLDGNVLEIRIPEPGDGYELPDTGPEREAERSPEELMQSDDPAIIEAARKAVGSETDSVTSAARLNKWVYLNLKKTGALTIPSAREVLESKEGDCNEHSQLFTAMARSIGLPARVVAGVVYLEGAFYYHAWSEVWLGEDSGWVPIDPTFGQFPADATHVRLVVGALKAQAEIARFVGKLSIKVLNYE